MICGLLVWLVGLACLGCLCCDCLVTVAVVYGFRACIWVDWFVLFVGLLWVAVVIVNSVVVLRLLYRWLTFAI